MSIHTGCHIPESQALCVMNNYLSDVSAMCPLGLVWNATYNTRIAAIALTAFSVLKICMATANYKMLNKTISKSCDFLIYQSCLNIALLVIGGLTTLAAGMSKNNPSWIKSTWNYEINNCLGQKKRDVFVTSTSSPACMANPSWHIIHSENVTCCFSNTLEQQWKSTHTPMLPVIFAVAGLGLVFFMTIADCVMNRPVDDSETQPINVNLKSRPVSSARVVLAICNIVMAVLLFGSAIGTTVTSFSYKYCLPDWLNKDLDTCICDSPR